MKNKDKKVKNKDKKYMFYLNGTKITITIEHTEVEAKDSSDNFFSFTDDELEKIRRWHRPDVF